jgi:hypothetical protein
VKRLRRVRNLLDPMAETLERLREEDARTAAAFSDVMAAAAEGTYFRTLTRAVRGSVPFGQPVDFTRLVAELAKLEQRIADLESERA